MTHLIVANWLFGQARRAVRRVGMIKIDDFRIGTDIGKRLSSYDRRVTGSAIGEQGVWLRRLDRAMNKGSFHTGRGLSRSC